MEHSFKAMATRADNAERQFIECLCEAGEITETEARKVADLYFKNKLAKIDYGIGHVNVKHGALYDKDVIRRALDMA